MIDNETRNKIDVAIDMVREELEAAMRRFAPMASAHEGYAVILEELDELWKEIKSGEPTLAYREAIQVAAMSLRFLVDVYDEQGRPI